MLIDAETGRRVDVLPGRTADLVEQWLRSHPGVQVVCRDGAGSHGKAVRRVLYAAVQVSDRWHLWHGLAEAVQKEVAAHSACWASVAPGMRAPPGHVAQHGRFLLVKALAGFRRRRGIPVVLQEMRRWRQRRWRGCSGNTSYVNVHIVNGGLSAGLSINSGTGLITGTPATAGTSTVVVTVRDTTGAAASATFTWTVSGGSPPPGSGCQVSYVTQSQWAGGFVAQLTITSSSPVSSWTLGFTFPGDQKITNAWNDGSYTHRVHLQRHHRHHLTTR